MKSEQYCQREPESTKTNHSLTGCVRIAVMTAMLAGCGTKKSKMTDVPVIDPIKMAHFTPEAIFKNMPERRLNIQRNITNEKGVLGVQVVNESLETNGYSNSELLALSMFIDTSSRAYFKPGENGLLEVGVSPEAILESYPMTCPPFRIKCATDAEYYELVKKTYEKKIYSMVSPMISVFEGAGSINYDANAPKGSQISLCINFSEYFDTEEGKLMIANMKNVPAQIRADIQEWEMAISQQVNPAQAKVYIQQVHNMKLDKMVETLIAMVNEIPDNLEICRMIPYNRKFEGYIDSFGEILALKIAIMNHILNMQQP